MEAGRDFGLRVAEEIGRATAVVLAARPGIEFVDVVSVFIRQPIDVPNAEWVHDRVA